MNAMHKAWPISWQNGMTSVFWKIQRICLLPAGSSHDGSSWFARLNQGLAGWYNIYKLFQLASWVPNWIILHSWLAKADCIFWQAGMNWEAAAGWQKKMNYR